MGYQQVILKSQREMVWFIKWIALVDNPNNYKFIGIAGFFSFEMVKYKIIYIYSLEIGI